MRDPLIECVLIIGVYPWTEPLQLRELKALYLHADPYMISVYVTSVQLYLLIL